MAFMNEKDLQLLGEKISKEIRDLENVEDRILCTVDFLIYCDAIKPIQGNDELYLVDLKEMEFQIALMGASRVRDKFEELTYWSK